MARDNGLELPSAAAGTATPAQASADGGIVLDLAGMKALEIAPSSGTAWAEAGLTAGEYTAAVGATGWSPLRRHRVGRDRRDHLGGGGSGSVPSKHGLTIDNLSRPRWHRRRPVSGRDDHHPYLFWPSARRGTSAWPPGFKFRCTRLETIVGGMLLLPADADVHRRLHGRATAAPEELSAIAT